MNDWVCCQTEDEYQDTYLFLWYAQYWISDAMKADVWRIKQQHEGA